MFTSSLIQMGLSGSDAQRLSDKVMPIFVLIDTIRFFPNTSLSCLIGRNSKDNEHSKNQKRNKMTLT